jgi:hypothetical protein
MPNKPTKSVKTRVRRKGGLVSHKAKGKMTGKSGTGAAKGKTAQEGDKYTYNRESARTNKRGTKKVEKGTVTLKDKSGKSVPGMKMNYKTKTRYRKK